MKEREVPEGEVVERFIEFCRDLGAEGNSCDEINEDIEKKGFHIQKNEDANLIWFENLENNQVKYYSEPILKYVCEPEKEMHFYVKADGPISMLHIPKSSMPLHNFYKKSKGKIPPLEETRDKQKRERNSYIRHIKWAFEKSVLGYVLFDGKAVLSPELRDGAIIVYSGNSPDTISCYNDVELLKDLLLDKDKYKWYELGDKYFIVRKSAQTEYNYLANEETQEIKLAKIVGEQVVLEDIVKDKQTLQIEKEIDANLKMSETVGYNDTYIRFSDNCFEVVKNGMIPIDRIDNTPLAIAFTPRTSKGFMYQKVETALTYEEILKVVKESNKYKWLLYLGKLYIARKFGGSKIGFISGDYELDNGGFVECLFKYNNSPYDMVTTFIKTGVFDGEELLRKYNCGQKSLDNIVSRLICLKVLERECFQSNKYKIIDHRKDLHSTIMYCIENKLKL